MHGLRKKREAIIHSPQLSLDEGRVLVEKCDPDDCRRFESNAETYGRIAALDFSHGVFADPNSTSQINVAIKKIRKPARQAAKKDAATATTTTYSCPSGYTYNGSQCSQV